MSSKETVKMEESNACTESHTQDQFQLPPSTPSLSSPGTRKKRAKELSNEFYYPLRKTNEKPSVSKSKQAISEHAVESVSCKRQNSALVGLHSLVQVKTPAMIRAEEIQSSLGSEFPCFAKSLVRSQVSSCFWMGLPMAFCKSHLPKKDTAVILEDESGQNFELKFIAAKTGLSGGWRNFAVGHKLLEGDVMIFQLVEPNKFKVYVVRANDLTEVDGALSLLNLDAHTNQNGTDDAKTGEIALNNKKRRHRNSLPLAVVKKKQKTDDAENGEIALKTKGKRSKSNTSAVVNKTCHPKSVAKPMDSVQQLDNDSEEVGSEVLIGPRFSGSAVRFRDIKNFEDFSILVDGLCIDSEIPEHLRVKYYELCCSRNTFIHARLLSGLNVKLVAGTICETVNIASAIRASKITTSRDDFEIWEKTLKSFELMGMKVGFLRARLRSLVSLATKSEVDLDTRRFIEAKAGKDQVDDEIRNLEAKVVALKVASEKFGADIEVLKAKVESYEQKFQGVVDAPW